MTQFYDRYRLPDPKWEKELRVCSVCQLKDFPIYAHEANTDGTPKFIHQVVMDITFVANDYELTKKDIQATFMLMPLEGTRKAKVRMICRRCLDADEDTKEIWNDFHKAAKNAGEDNYQGGYYMALCSE